jgi:signal recognition particle subunit SRP54
MAKDYTLDDFRQLLDQFEKMGLSVQITGMPGLSAMISEKEGRDLSFCRIRRMLDAMTDEERKNPKLITGSSLSRIAGSSGTRPQDVEDFLAQFTQFNDVRASARQMFGMSVWQRIKLAMGFRKISAQEQPPN